MNKLLWAFVSIISVASFFSSQSTFANEDYGRNTAEYYLESGIGLKGFDPVAIFPEGGGRPLAGKNELRLDYMGVTYLFSSSENLNLFLTNPDRYEPTYGGWCAFAMASGTKVEIQTDIFTISGNRAHYFFSQRAKRNFDRDIPGFELNADRFWKQISGENARQ